MNMGEKIPTIVKPLITERGASFSEGIFQVTTIANNRDYSVNTYVKKSNCLIREWAKWVSLWVEQASEQTSTAYWSNVEQVSSKRASWAVLTNIASGRVARSSRVESLETGPYERELKCVSWEILLWAFSRYSASAHRSATGVGTGGCIRPCVLCCCCFWLSKDSYMIDLNVDDKI